MLIKRREFLKISSLATASMLMPNFLKAMTLDEALNPNQNILVVLQFTGGNDGLNTIIPAKNDIYFRERKTLAFRILCLLQMKRESTLPCLILKSFLIAENFL
jgi:uncharacterized protein (DUF1501 family)